MERWREARGQATSEYVALVALVAVVLALAAGLTAGGVGGQLLAGMQRGLCRVVGTACARPVSSADELSPCPLERTTSGESLDGAFEAIKVGGGATLRTVRSSDGRVTVTLARDASTGGELGVGAKLALGRWRGGKATAEVDVRHIFSRSWTLPSAAAARAFVDRYGSKATLGGRAVDLVRSGCSILCDAIGWRPHTELPPPDEVSLGSGAAAQLTVAFGAAGIHASNGSLLGVQLRRDGTSTWFIQLDAAVAAELALGAAESAAGSQRQSVIAYTLDARRRPTELAIETVVQRGGAAAIGGGRARTNATLAAGEARVTELDATLELRDPHNRTVVAALARALRDPFAIRSLRRRAAAVYERIRRAGVVNRRTYALSSSGVELGAKLALGARLGGAFTRTREGMRLVSAETRLPGLPFLPRDDCRPS
ncbi:MAG TPA: hypothetical protein VFG31_02085 [Conexibacter sp.]|nr:hypothetical protein [Conexibacter sp.]